MNYSPELLLPQQVLHTPEERAERFARAVTQLVISQTISHETILPDDPNYTVVLDDPTGHFPLQHISPLNLGAELGSCTHRIFAKANVDDPRQEEVSRLRILQATLRGSLRPEDRVQRDEYNRTARRVQRSIPLPRQFTFRNTSLLETLRVIRPIDDPKYLNIR